MRAGFEMVSRNQPSYRPRMTRIEVSVHAGRIAAFGELVRLYRAHRHAQEAHSALPLRPVV
jgi:hypothetical protein